jgi:hypothetical protein
MPLVRCLGCNEPIDVNEVVKGRCKPCYRALRRTRDAGRIRKPPPQDGLCWRCGEPARPDDPFVWGHVDAFRDGGTAVAPEHRLCNARAAR